MHTKQVKKKGTEARGTCTFIFTLIIYKNYYKNDILTSSDYKDKVKWEIKQSVPKYYFFFLFLEVF